MPFGGVTAHRQPDAIEREILEAAIRRAYSWNYYDSEIARYAGCSEKTVERWRERRGLPSNYHALAGIGVHGHGARGSNRLG